MGVGLDVQGGSPCRSLGCRGMVGTGRGSEMMQMLYTVLTILLIVLVVIVIASLV